jgi:hypothetical protein
MVISSGEELIQTLKSDKTWQEKRKAIVFAVPSMMSDPAVIRALTYVAFAGGPRILMRAAVTLLGEIVGATPGN